MRSITRFLMVAAVAATWHVSAPAANAQSQSPESPAPGTSATEIPDHKLEATAVAIVRVAALKQDYEGRIAEAPANERKRIADEAQSALVKAVTDQGLSVDEYTKILEVAQNDTGIREKILQRIRPPDEETKKNSKD